MPKGFKSLRGMLLLDGGKLLGSVFHRSVVLVCQHEPGGALGLVLNQPTRRTLGEVVDTSVPGALEAMPVFTGGPVQPMAVSYLFQDMDQPAANVMENLQFGTEFERLIQWEGAGGTADRARVFAGYAGWAAGQLDDEMRRDSWLLHKATLELVFRIPPELLWRHILRSKGDWQSRLLADSPEDLSWN